MAAATGCAESSSNSSGSVLTQCPTRWSCPSTDWPAAGMPTTTCDWLDSRDNSAAKLASRVANRLTPRHRSEAHTSELQSLMRISYAVFCLKKKTHTTQNSDPL